MFGILPLTNQISLATNQVFEGYEQFLQKLESSFTFCNKFCWCCEFSSPSQTCFAAGDITPVYGVTPAWNFYEFSSQKSVFTQLAATWFVAWQLWTWVVKHATLLFILFFVERFFCLPCVVPDSLFYSKCSVGFMG